jgi:hypothetical protein
LQSAAVKYYNSLTDPIKERFMNRIVTAAVLLICLLAPLTAQESSRYQKRDVYTKTFPIAKIWSSRYGYRVDYVNTKLDINVLYIKAEYFSGTTGKAVLAYGRGPEYPYMSVTWVAGEIDHVTIYAVDSPGAYSWGVLHGGDELKNLFPDDIQIKF